MKIGTDAVLLGAWTPLSSNPQSILDIGTGTGILSLMLAQRSDAEIIDALEIEDGAFEQAVENFENSPWSDRLFCYHAAFDEFVEEVHSEQDYDLIISNPPFHQEENYSENLKRKQARFSEALPLAELLAGVVNLLSVDGVFSLIIPYSSEKSFLSLVKEYHLYPKKLTRVRGSFSSPVKRVLLVLARKQGICLEDELVLEESRHQYTAEYSALVKDFYLKM